MVGAHASNPTSRVYNFVLENGHVIDIDDYRFVTLGNGLVLTVGCDSHFGSSKQIETLRKHPDWDSGLITMSWKDALKSRLSRDEHQETLGLSRVLDFLFSPQFTANNDLSPLLLLHLHEAFLATPYSCKSEFRHGSVKVVIAGSCHLPPRGCLCWSLYQCSLCQT